MSDTQNDVAGAAERKPNRRSCRSARRAADPGMPRRLIRVSNVAVTTGVVGEVKSANHSRRPLATGVTVSPACSLAACRVLRLLMPNACVGPPTTSSPTSSVTVVGALDTSTARHVDMSGDSFGDGLGNRVFVLTEHRFIDHERTHRATSS